VPSDIKDLLSARALAYWIMDDGSMDFNGSTQLHTDTFSPKELDLLQEALSINFNLRTRLIKKRPGQWAIVIPLKQEKPLIDIVGPYMHESMLYKVKK